MIFSFLSPSHRRSALLALAFILTTPLVSGVVSQAQKAPPSVEPMVATAGAASPQQALAPAPSIGVPRAQCFPVERLRPDLRVKAEDALLRACDSEGLYTVVGAIKPMSTGWLSVSLVLDKPDPKKVDEMRQVVAALRCGNETSSHVYSYAKSYDKRVLLEGAIFSRTALRTMVGQRQEFWNGLGVTPEVEPLGAVLATENATSALRFRGYGYLFGYPSHAVDFFVNASVQQETDPTKKLVPRDFLSIPTITRDTNRFVYAVPKGHQPNAEDLALRARCAPIFAEYKRRRAQYIGTGKPGIVALLRDWFDNGKGRCSPSFARIPGRTS